MEQVGRPGGAELARQARAEARARAERDVQEIAAQFGARTLSRFTDRSAEHPGPPVEGADAVAALEAAHELELAAHALAGEYIRKAREAGRSREVIGDALGLLFVASANKIGVGEQALDYALTYVTGPGRRRYTWQCPACQQVITDRGPFPEVPQQEEGHDPTCPRRTAQLAAWEKRRAGH